MTQTYTCQIADAHYDLGAVLYNQICRGNLHPMKDLLLPQWRAQGVGCIVGAIFIDNLYLPEKALSVALDQIAVTLAQIQETADQVCLVTSKQTLHQALEEGKIAIVLSLEGLEPIGTDLHLLQIFHQLGVRLAGLVWSRQNAVGDGSRFQGRATNHGLTSFGLDVLEQLHHLGMVVDISHLNDAGADDVFAHFLGPVIASHSNARAIHPITRNLTNAQAVAIQQTGGIIGINGVKPLVTADFAHCTQAQVAQALCQHIHHYATLVGMETLCLGLDRCNLLSSTSLRQGNRDNHDVDVLDDYSQLNQVSDGLLQLGYTNSQIQGLFSSNLLTFLDKHLPG